MLPVWPSSVLSVMGIWISSLSLSLDCQARFLFGVSHGSDSPAENVPLLLEQGMLEHEALMTASWPLE